MTKIDTTKKIALLAAALLLALVAVPGRKVAAQAAPTQLNIAIYAPSAGFADSSARLSYVQGIAKAVQQKTGIPTTGKAYASWGSLMSAKPDFAIIDGQCIAAKSPGTLLAVASIGGSTTQSWALFTRGDSLGELKGKKLAYVDTGCRDSDFLDNAMLESEVKTASYFGGLVKQSDAPGAVAAVRDYKKADAVFAPASAGRGLTKLFDTGQVPNPGFVQLNKQIPGQTANDVASAVLSYGAGVGGIDGWKGAAQNIYQSLAGRMGARSKKPIFAQPEVVRVEDQDVLVIPESSYEQAAVKQHFWVPDVKRKLQ